MAYAYRGRRVAYDNVAAGSVAGYENHISTRPWDGLTAVSAVSDTSNGVSDVSVQGDAMVHAGISNIAVGSSYGIEDTNEFAADGTVSPRKLTSDLEDVEDAG